MKRKITFSNFGFSTILLCFVMICVVTFSALSLVSAYSDYKLSKKVADKTKAYYKAQEAAYDKLAAIDELTIEAYHVSENAQMYYDAIKGSASSYGTITEESDSLRLTFTETIAEDHFLQVTLKICYPISGSDSFIEIVEWKSYYEKTAPEDNILDLID